MKQIPVTILPPQPCADCLAEFDGALPGRPTGAYGKYCRHHEALVIARWNGRAVVQAYLTGPLTPEAAKSAMAGFVAAGLDALTESEEARH